QVGVGGGRGEDDRVVLRVVAELVGVNHQAVGVLGVDARAAGRSGGVVGGGQVPLDQRRAVGGGEDADGGVGDGGVADGQVRGRVGHHDAGAELVGVALVADGEAVDGDVGGGDVERRRPVGAVDGAVEDRLDHTGAGTGIDAGLGAE